MLTPSISTVLAAAAGLVAGLAERVAAPSRNRWLAVVVALVAIICVAVASCMHPRRGHRD